MWSPFRRQEENPGLLWLDQGAAAREIDRKAARGEISHEEESRLRKFAADGYFTVQLEVTEEDALTIDRDVDRLWHERPDDVAFAFDSPPLRFSQAVETEQRKPRYRIHELHCASEVALRLYLDRTLHRYASLILGETAVATQSLYFQFGSQQALHRDSTVVPTPEFGRLVAAWIALEDIDPASGPLAYVPGSQRFPFFNFRSGGPVYDPSRHTGAEVEEAMKFYADTLTRSDLPTHTFLGRRGEALIWHSALMHGGAPPTQPERTRKSLVVHYSTLRGQTTRECAVTEADGSGQSVYTTSEVLEREGARGFANPLRGTLSYRR